MIKKLIQRIIILFEMLKITEVLKLRFMHCELNSPNLLTNYIRLLHFHCFSLFFLRWEFFFWGGGEFLRFSKHIFLILVQHISKDFLVTFFVIYMFIFPISWKTVSSGFLKQKRVKGHKKVGQ